MVETRAQQLERVNYEMLRGQQQILLVATEAERMVKSDDVAATPQELIDTLDTALDLITKATPIVNSASTVTDAIRTQNEENLANMTAKARETRDLLTKRLNENNEAQIKINFASLIEENSELIEEYLQGKRITMKFGIWTDEIFEEQKFDFKDKASKSRIDWEVAEYNAKQLQRIKLQLSHNFYEVEKLQAENAFLKSTPAWDHKVKSYLAELEIMASNIAQFMQYKMVDSMASMKISEEN